MYSGLLSGKMTRARIEELAEDDWRRKSENFQEPLLSKNLGLVEVLRDIDDQHGCTPGEVAIAWTLLNPAITGTIIGLRRPDQVDGVAHSAGIQLTDDNIQSIKTYMEQI